MSDERAPQKSWPFDYYVGPPEHLHAFGVLLTPFNSFEDGIFSLYRHHLDRALSFRGDRVFLASG